MKSMLVLLPALMLASMKSGEKVSPGSLQLSFHGRDFNRDPNHNPSFYKQCVTLVATNTSSVPATILLPAGTFLQPTDESVQRFMITKSENIFVKPKSTVKQHIFAMCTEAHDGGPGPKTVFTLGTSAPPNWVKLAALIEEKNYQNTAAQHAVWALSDNYPQSNVYDEDKTATMELRNYIAGVRHEAVLPYEAPHGYSSRWFKSIPVEYDYNLHVPHRVTLKVYTGENLLLKTVYENKMIPVGDQHYADTMYVPLSFPGERVTLKIYRWDNGALTDIKYFNTASTDSLQNGVRN